MMGNQEVKYFGVQPSVKSVNMSQALLFANDVIAVKQLLNFLRRGNV